MSYENKTTAELCNTWNAASADLAPDTNWMHHRSAHRTIASVKAELERRGFFDRPTCWDINKKASYPTVEVD